MEAGRIIPRTAAGRLCLLWPLLLSPLGCQDEMRNRGKIRPLELSTFFQDGKSARDLVPGTVPRGGPPSGAGTGRQFAHLDQLPVPLTRELLRRGQEEYNVFCSVCHGAAGYGDGMIVRRGFTPPPSFHTPTLRESSLGHFVEVITDGRGAMYSYSDRVPLADRWAIAAYIRALQLSQHAYLNTLPEEDARRAREIVR